MPIPGRILIFETNSGAHTEDSDVACLLAKHLVATGQRLMDILGEPSGPELMKSEEARRGPQGT